MAAPSDGKKARRESIFRPPGPKHPRALDCM
jgi:hypothetical protein